MDRRHLLKAMISGATFALAGLMKTGGAGAVGDTNSGAAMKTNTPTVDGFYFPAEWSPHQGTIMQFVPEQNWGRHDIEGPRKEWAMVANTVAEFEPVIMAVDPADKKIAAKMLSGAIEQVEYPLNDGWSRDSGPMILVDDKGNRAVAGFEFNSWGRKFHPYDDDAQFKARMAAHLDFPFYPAPMTLEGGAVILDGEGTCITTAECLLHTNRNPGMSKADVEEVLAQWLGVKKVIWLPLGLTPDPITDGHIDGLAAYVAPGVVMVHTTADPGDPNYRICNAAVEILGNTTDARGRALEIITLPLAETVVHMNYYVCNGGVVVPTAGNAGSDDNALGIIRDAFPGRKVVGVSGNMISEGGGGVHCITQQIPAV
jgi:agmatine deiminase